MNREDYTRVTTIVGHFIDWSHIPEQILEAKAELGTLVHRLIELYLMDISIGVIPEEALGYFESFKKFWEASSHAWDTSTLRLEDRLFCDKHKISGQPDLVITGNGKTHVIDWKTSTTIHKTYPLQGAAYRYLASESGYDTVEPTMIVRLNKDGKKPVLFKQNDDSEELEMFFKHLDVYRYHNPLGKYE